MVMGVGTSFNDVHCEFPGDLNPGDDMFEGVRFAVLNEEIVMNYQKRITDNNERMAKQDGLIYGKLYLMKERGKLLTYFMNLQVMPTKQKNSSVGFSFIYH